MSGPPNDKDYTAPDILASAIEPTRSRDEPDFDQALRQTLRDDETSDGDLGEKGDATSTDRNAGSHGKGEHDESDENDATHDMTRNPALTVTRSYATDTSAATGALGHPEPEDKPWYKKMNPLRWGAIPPIPEEPIVSREEKAGFFSQLFFSWMTPLMTVSPDGLSCQDEACASSVSFCQILPSHPRTAY